MDSASIVADTARRILADTCDPQTVNRAATDAWKVPAWRALETAGLPLAWVPEALGGAGAEMADGFAVLREAGRFAAPLPLSETLLAGWLLAQAGISAPPGAMTCGPTRDGDRLALAANGTLNGRLRAVPFARDARHLALLVRREQGGAAIALVETGSARLADGASLAGDPLNAVTLSSVRPIAVRDAPGGVDENALLLMGAAVRSVTMAGALESILDITVSYANERFAFERVIAKFQAVQHNLARLAGETAAAMAAAGSAADAIATGFPSPLWGAAGGGDAAARAGDEGVFLGVASAKIRVGEAAGEGAGIGHQVMGAIGFTQEHTLHRFTRRLWSWRDDFGNESYWAARLGAMVAARGADGLWPMLAER